MSKSETKWLERTIDWVESSGYTDIKSSHDDYESPRTFTMTRADETVEPHVSAKRKGTKYYFEVATKTTNVSKLVSKWKLLSHLARRTGGKLFLLVPKGHKSFTEKLCERYLPSVQVIYQRHW